MRAWMALAGVLAAGGAGAQEARPLPDFWPPDGKMGIGGIVVRRTSETCTISLMLMNRTGEDFREVWAEMEVFIRGDNSVVATASFRLADNRRGREAEAWVRQRCPRNPRVTIRTLRCRAEGQPPRDCLTLAQPATPPADNPERVRLTITDPWAGVRPIQ